MGRVGKQPRRGDRPADQPLDCVRDLGGPDRRRRIAGAILDEDVERVPEPRLRSDLGRGDLVFPETREVKVELDLGGLLFLDQGDIEVIAVQEAGIRAVRDIEKARDPDPRILEPDRRVRASGIVRTGRRS